MNDRKRRLRSIQLQLNEIYEDLFGAKYVPGLQEVDKSEFNTIIDTFRERLFTVRQLQKQRDKNETKRGYKRTPADIKVNQTIRDEIKTCEKILKEAVHRKDTDLKSKMKTKQITAKIMDNREKTLKNCFELLSDIKDVEEGGKYKAPKREETLEDLKKRLVERDEDEQRIDFEDEEKFEKYKKKDLEIEEGLEEVIDVNRQIQLQMKAANQKIDETGVRIQQNLLKANKVEQKIKKGQRDLEQVLKHYRRPNKLCLDITLVLLLLALIGVIITMVKNSS